MDVLRAKHLRVNQLPPAELKELKICPSSAAAPPCDLTYLRCSLAGPLNQSRRRATSQQHRTEVSQCRQRICLEQNKAHFLPKMYIYIYSFIHAQSYLGTAEQKFASEWGSSVLASCHLVVQSQSGMIPISRFEMITRCFGLGCVITDMIVYHHTWLRLTNKTNEFSVFRSSRRFDLFDDLKWPWSNICVYGYFFHFSALS